jgi:hypothetical protein
MDNDYDVHKLHENITNLYKSKYVPGGSGALLLF